MIAVIETGGKQYKVREKQRIQVEKLPGNIGTEFVLDKVLLIADDAEKEIQIGNPYVPGGKVTVKIIGNNKGRKVDVIKFRSKVRYRRKTGHRQPFTEISVEKIAA